MSVKCVSLNKSAVADFYLLLSLDNEFVKVFK